MSSKFKNLQFGNKADAYLEWAQHTGFTHFGGVLPAESGKRIGLLVRWKTPDLELFKQLDATMAAVYFGQQVSSITIPQNNLHELFTAGSYIDFVELATPLAVAIEGSDSQDYLKITSHDEAADESEVLLGCIDDGFPIASEQYHQGQTRWVRFWNQEHNPLAIGKDLGVNTGDPQGTNFGYGRELMPLRPTTMTAVARNPVWALPTSDDAKDDMRYYQRMQLRRSMYRATHGAHVLDVLAGALPVRSRISASRDMVNGEDGSATQPPSWESVDSAATEAPIVLVQLPAYALDDPSGRWLGRNVLDGLHYIVQTAKLLDQQRKDTRTIKKIVINLSWGPQTGPHNGTSLLEVAIDDLIAQEGERDCTLEVTLPAGNSYEARAHAEFSAAKGARLCWCVPPGAQSPAFLEIWWPEGTDGDTAQLKVTAPDGKTFLESTGEGIWSQPLDGATTVTNPHRWGITRIKHPGGFMALIALAPTFSHDPISATAPHGEWHIEVGAVGSIEGAVHAYVARADHNMGTKRRAQPSYLRDVVYEESRRSVKAEETASVEGSSVQKCGTLNGIGTGKATKMAAGFRLSDGLPARYSSSGPSRGSARRAPDFAYPTEASRLVHGIPGAGTRSGTVVNLSGTSSAAPQYARELAVGAEPVAKTPIPLPGDGEDTARPQEDPDPRIGKGRR